MVGGMHGGGLHSGGCVWVGGCMWQAACMAEERVWAGGMHATHVHPSGYYEIRSVNARVVRILLECILVGAANPKESCLVNSQMGDAALRCRANLNLT